MRLSNLPLTTLCLAVVTALSGCGGGGSSSPAPNGPTVQSITATTTLAYYHYGYFTVTGTGLSAAGITLSDSTGKCQSAALRAGIISTDTTLAFQCALFGSGTISLDIKDAAGTVLGTQTFNVPDPKVRITTSLGSMDVLLNPTAAPETVLNFISYVYGTTNSPNFYSGTVFHRVIRYTPSTPFGIIQTGGFSSSQSGTTSLTQKLPLFNPVPLKASNGLMNTRGSIAMARLGGTCSDSATSQFYFNTINNPGFNGNYTVFGTIDPTDTNSLTTLDLIAAVATGTKTATQYIPNTNNPPTCPTTQTTTSSAMTDVPTTDVTITSITQIQ
jgi:cyclophilin family peptidyl-prolyl cis-trans isomerase